MLNFFKYFYNKLERNTSSFFRLNLVHFLKILLNKCILMLRRSDKINIVSNLDVFLEHNRIISNINYY